MPDIPRSTLPDDTISMAREGYRFISNRCKRYNTDLFETRLMLTKTICIRGEKAAEIFYNSEYFERKGVAPEFIKSTLFGHGGVQGMDNESHRHRKAMFMALMDEEKVDQFGKLAAEQWRKFSNQWEQKERIHFFYEVQKLICKTVCMWTGVPLEDLDLTLFTRDLAAMIDGSGSFGPRHWKGRLSRNRTEKKIGRLIEQVRNNELNDDYDDALHVIARHRDTEGNLLDVQTAAVELINILRPTVAISRFITFAALALHHYPLYKEKLRNGSDHFMRSFVHEVRRYYPFFPFVMAQVKKDFIWQDYKFPKGRRVMLDLYGTNHDPRIWKEPERFWPERFQSWDGSSYTLIPQGGGNHYKNHRCPGELPTVKLMEISLNFMINNLRYDVPDQNLDINLSRVPAIPFSRFFIENIEQVGSS